MSEERGSASTEIDLRRAYIWRVYNTPDLHGSYCPCAGCASISGPLPGWIHEIGRLPSPPGHPTPTDLSGGRA